MILNEYLQDLKKGAMSDGYEMDYTVTLERLKKVGGGDLKTFSKVGLIFQTLWGCDQIAKYADRADRIFD